MGDRAQLLLIQPRVWCLIGYWAKVGCDSAGRVRLDHDPTAEPMTPISTDRLILRLPEAADTRAMREIHEDPVVVKHTITLPTQPVGDTFAWRNIASLLGHWQMRGYGHFAVVERASGAVIGRAGLYYPEGWPGVELGWIIRPSRWGHGFATEAARAVLGWTWENTSVDHVISLIEPTNTQWG